MNQKITPPWIKDLKDSEVFVFGSNESGVHGAGAALTAKIKWEAIMGMGFGPQGKCFGIPTKDWAIEVLPVPSIKNYVDAFTRYAQLRPYSTFLVTEIGCGLSGYTPEEIAPLFKSCMELDNVKLPLAFYEILKQK